MHGGNMIKDAVLEHWNQRAALAERAGSQDLVAKQLEIRAISQHIKDGMVVAEFGCGNGSTAFELAHKHDIDLHCFDFSPAMIDSARKQAQESGVSRRIQFQVCDIRNEPALARRFDTIFTERMLINLPTWRAQSKAIRYLIRNLNVGGHLLMCENSQEGLAEINKLRKQTGLEPISPPWHNEYLSDELVAALEIPGAKLTSVEPFSATYYFLSRVVNAWLSEKDGKQPSYDAPVNQLALDLSPFGNCALGTLWIFEKTKV
jgi:ubiquinone/menaquinone biosynthesis C-methylase UbiE